jgi:hypothetical protein
MAFAFCRSSMVKRDKQLPRSRSAEVRTPPNGSLLHWESGGLLPHPKAPTSCSDWSVSNPVEQPDRGLSCLRRILLYKPPLVPLVGTCHVFTERQG